jgi:SsrA-binding protein
VSTTNKKAYFDYEIVQEIEAGLVLSGSEVKSVRAGQVSLSGSRVLRKEDGMYVIGMSIYKYEMNSQLEYDALRTRKVLLKRNEIVAISTKMKSSNLTLVPLKLYNKGKLIKLMLGLVRGKKKYEKREIIKKRDVERGLANRLKFIK